MQSLSPIFSDCGLKVERYETVHGGDINQAFCLYTSGQRFFLKVNDAMRYPGMFQKEANGLHALKNNFDLLVPQVIATGSIGNKQYLLMEWMDTGKRSLDFWETFGKAIAKLHKLPQAFFGWDTDNYIGSLIQKNTIHHLWHSFFSECRIMALVKYLVDNGSFSKHDLNSVESFCKKAENIFPLEAPSLLHGDLWNGNFMVDKSGIAAIYDPAVYCGHREMDIGMTKLFGGFDQRFYDAYYEEYPLEKDWKKRLNITQLYPLLVHACLFGGRYIQSAREIIKDF